MSIEKLKEPVLLFCGIMYTDESLLNETIRLLEEKYGHHVEGYSFNVTEFTNYYEKEMGTSIKKKFISFENLIVPEESFKIKKFTNSIERKFMENSQRIINIDPGYMSLAKLILFSSKNFYHRIYLGEGIYAEITLNFHKPSFCPLKWTYPDYKDAKAIEYFNSLRIVYKEKLNSITK